VAFTIVYYSQTGNNHILAEYLAARLRCGAVRIEETRRRTAFTTILDLLFGRLPRLEKHLKCFGAYDHLILVAPVWASRLASPLRTFLSRERRFLPAYSFITVCGYERPGQKERLAAELSRRVGRPPVAVCELRVSDLVPAEDRNRIGAVTAHRICHEDLGSYDVAIEAFLAATQGKGANASRGMTPSMAARTADLVQASRPT
jgi:hypothetical protein